jgi:hypothetical protein
MRKALSRALGACGLLLILAALIPPQPQGLPPTVQIRGRQHFAVYGQPVRNALRAIFGGVRTAPTPAQPQQ